MTAITIDLCCFTKELNCFAKNFKIIILIILLLLLLLIIIIIMIIIIIITAMK